MTMNLLVNHLTTQTIDIDANTCTCDYCKFISPSDFDIDDYTHEENSQQAFLKNLKSEDEVLLYGFRINIGRDEDNQVILNDSSVSRHHAQITVVDNKYYIEDINSKNGTYVNGKYLKAKMELKAGDIIRIGMSQFEIHIDQDSFAKLAPVIDIRVNSVIKSDRLAIAA